MEMSTETSLNSLKLSSETPICSECGIFMSRNGQSETWGCNNCSESISLSHWKVVMLHATVAHDILQNHGIENVVFSDMLLDIKLATSSCGLLPLFVLGAEEFANASGLHNGLCIDIDDADISNVENGMSVMPHSVVFSKPEVHISESLQLLSGTIENAILKKEEYGDTSSTLNLEYIAMPNDIAVEPVLYGAP